MPKRPTTVREATRPKRKVGDPITLGRQAGQEAEYRRTPSDRKGGEARHEAELTALLEQADPMVRDAYYSEAGEAEWQTKQARIHARHARILQAKVRRLEAELEQAETETGRALFGGVPAPETWARVAFVGGYGSGKDAGRHLDGHGKPRHSEPRAGWWCLWCQTCRTLGGHSEHCPNRIPPPPIKPAWKPKVGTRVRIRDCPEAHAHCFHRDVGAVGTVLRLPAGGSLNYFVDLDDVRVGLGEWGGRTVSVPLAALEPDPATVAPIHVDGSGNVTMPVAERESQGTPIRVGLKVVRLSDGQRGEVAVAGKELCSVRPDLGHLGVSCGHLEAWPMRDMCQAWAVDDGGWPTGGFVAFWVDRAWVSRFMADNPHLRLLPPETP